LYGFYYSLPMEINNKKILLLTLVHPDFLPPVYAVGQVLRDLGFNIHILTFDSFVPAELDLGKNIEVESVGKHYDANILGRLQLRNKFEKRARQLVAEKPIAIISFCPFSFNCGLKIKNGIPLAYIVLEIADFVLPVFLHSPLSNLRNYRALKNIEKADFVATPSIQRSAWLAGRCHLRFMPETILNTAYIPQKEDADTYETFKSIVPAEFLNKKIILYTGGVNEDHCIIELVRAFGLVNDGGSALVITGVKDNEYCNRIKKIIEKGDYTDRVLLLPYVTRAEMLSLQANASIGVCLTREYDEVRTKMIAPNKVGEYLYRNLFILGTKNEYMLPLEMKGIASLAITTTPVEISKAIKTALKAVNDNNLRQRIKKFVTEQFSMQEQARPLIYFLNEINTIN
jgi:glycosyltransferase involved in cell wall biosynthesis